MVWVAGLAVPILGERLRPVHVVAMVMIVGGLVALVGGLRGFGFGDGELLLAATALRAVEAVIAKRLLAGTGRALSLARPRSKQSPSGPPVGAPAGQCREPGSMHWGWVCDVLDARRLATLRRYTLRQLEVANRTQRRPAADRIPG